MRKTGDQLGAEPLPLWKIRDRSTEGNGRPHRTAVFDFRFRARYEPQLVPESMYATRPDPLKWKFRSQSLRRTRESCVRHAIFVHELANELAGSRHATKRAGF
jgi:hypothetical protein